MAAIKQPIRTVTPRPATYVGENGKPYWDRVRRSILGDKAKGLKAILT
jgi:hypothetical protein